MTISNFLATFSLKLELFLSNPIEIKIGVLIKNTTWLVKKSPRILVSRINDSIMRTNEIEIQINFVSKTIY